MILTAGASSTGARTLVGALERTFSVLAFLGCCALLYSAVVSSGVVAVVVLLLICSAALNPGDSLLITIAFSPIANAAVGAPWHVNGNLAETLVLAAGGGILLRHAAGAERWHLGRSFGPVLILMAAILASLFVELAILRLQISPTLFGMALKQAVVTYQLAPSPIGDVIHPAARLLEGLLLYSVVRGLRGANNTWLRLLRMCVVAGCAAAALNIARVLTAAMRSDAPLSTLVMLLRTVRVSVPFTDVNATGSYFALALPVAIGFAAAAAGWKRAAYACAALLLATGIWTSGSRTALIAVLVIGIVLTLLRPLGARAIRLAAVACVVAALVVALFPNPLIARTATMAVTIRLELARTAIRLWSIDPIFGIGIGQFYSRSAEFIRDPRVLAIYPRENAHNNYLQILAELGLVGFGAFVWLLAAAGADIAARLRERPRSPPLIGAAAGLATFLLTCLGGHPLLITEVAFAFWTVLGIAAHSSRDPSPRSVAPLRRLALAAVLLIGVTVPLRALHAVNDTNMEHRGYGLSAWSFDREGNRYRRMEREATLFVPRDARAVELPYRLESPGPLVVLDVTLRDEPVDQLKVGLTTWQTHRFIIRARSNDPRFLRLTLKTVKGESSNVLLGKLTAHP